MTMRARLVAAIVVVALLAAGLWLRGWYGAGPLETETAFVVPDGSSLSSVAAKLEREQAIGSASAFLTRAKILGGSAPIKAGEFLLPAHASNAAILDTLQSGKVLRRFIAVPEGIPSIMVWDRLMAQPLLTGTIPVPEEGTLLPDSYDFERGEPRAKVVARMQAAMRKVLAEAWAKRAPNLVVKTPQEALTLASIVEKETGKASERRMVRDSIRTACAPGCCSRPTPRSSTRSRGASRSAAASASPRLPRSTITTPIR